MLLCVQEVAEAPKVMGPDALLKQKVAQKRFRCTRGGGLGCELMGAQALRAHPVCGMQVCIGQHERVRWPAGCWAPPGAMAPPPHTHTPRDLVPRLPGLLPRLAMRSTPSLSPLSGCREGYEEGASTTHRALPAAAFVAGDSPVEMLGQYTQLVLEGPGAQGEWGGVLCAGALGRSAAQHSAARACEATLPAGREATCPPRSARSPAPGPTRPGLPTAQGRWRGWKTLRRPRRWCATTPPPLGR